MPSSGRGNRSCRWTRKRRNWSGISRTPGREWHRRGHPEEVRAKDFPDKQLGKVVPEGVYDLTHNEGWVSVGIDHDTAEFAGGEHPALVAGDGVAGSIRGPTKLLVTADAGGSNGYRSRLWKVALQRLGG